MFFFFIPRTILRSRARYYERSDWSSFAITRRNYDLEMSRFIIRDGATDRLWSGDYERL